MPFPAIGLVTIGIRLLQKPVTLLSPGGGWVEGRWQSLPGSLSIKAEIQAATQNDLIQNGIGDSLDGYVRIWTETPLTVTDKDQGQDAQSIVTPQGQTYRIVRAGRRDAACFTRAIGRLSHDRGRSHTLDRD